MMQCAAGHRWTVNEGAGDPVRCKFCSLPGELLPMLTAADVDESERERRTQERYRREVARLAVSDLSETEQGHLRDRLRAKLAGLTITVDVSGMFSEDSLLDAVVALARAEMEAEGGSCSYAWHVSDEAVFEEGNDECFYCGKVASEHRQALICGRDPEEEIQ